MFGFSRSGPHISLQIPRGGTAVPAKIYDVRAETNSPGSGAGVRTRRVKTITAANGSKLSAVRLVSDCERLDPRLWFHDRRPQSPILRWKK